MAAGHSEQAARVIARCLALSRHSEEPDQIKRTFLSPAMRDCMMTLQGWMEAAGIATRIDNAGNLRGRYPAKSASSACLMIGSHLDTVPNSGAFDGVLGVVMGLALIEALQGERLDYAIELVGFSEEEGVSYGLPFIGSRAMVGSLDAAALATQDREGVSIARTLADFGLDPLRIEDCLVGDDVAAFLEIHIEQGIVLESENKPLGVVSAIAGQTRAELIFTGRANHAGSTPMHLRKDAVACAAEWVTEVESLALSKPGMVATVGELSPHPGVGNVIAGQVRTTLDLRHADDALRHPAVKGLLARARAIAERRGLFVASKILMDQAAVAMDARLCGLAAEAIGNLGIVPLTMVSGAGHDAMIVAERIPTTMIFLRSPGGISHHPEEIVLSGDVELALAAGVQFLRLFAGSYLDKEQKTSHA